MQESQRFFYLGKDENGAEVSYKNQDLTTHALIVGMTGSGKTGLGIGLIEEAAIDGIPSIIIDPKGDMGNLLLTFPSLSKEEFLPWIDLQEAENKNQSIEEAAFENAKLWENGLLQWDEDKGRIAMLKNSAKFTIYTPSASYGKKVNILSSFRALPQKVLDDEDTLNMLISSSAATILNLANINANSLSSKEHILVSSIFAHFYKNGKNIGLEEIVSSIVTPPFDKVGVFSLETFFPKEKRMDFAMKINAIIASPSFSSWLEGEDMDIDGFLFDKDKKPKVSIFNITHLGDNERMFFVTLLLNNLIVWMRSQEGSSSLKALIYMDEIFGFFPPNSNPSSKLPMLTLLKQARAFGLGIVLSTQNPIDLDYKGLSNIGTWFIGRLQTAQDKERVIDGLVGIKGSEFSRQELLNALSNLKKRHFLLKNINEEGLKIFQTRWTLSYLKGPLSKEQIKNLMGAEVTSQPKTEKAQQEKSTEQNVSLNFVSNLNQRYFYKTSSESYKLNPYLTCSAKVRFVNAKKGMEKENDIHVQTLFLKDGDINWHVEDITSLENTPRNRSDFGEISPFADNNKRLSALKKEAIDFIYKNAKVTIQTVPSLKMEAKINESKEEFKTRVEERLDKMYEEKYEELKALYDKKHKVVEDKFSKFNLKLAKEKNDVQNTTLTTVVNIGGGILGALLGGRKSSSISKTISTIKSANKIKKERDDVKNIELEIENIQNEAKEIETEFQTKIKALKSTFDIANIDFSEITITPRKTDIYCNEMFILWREI
ncbi:MAG: DUF87 domain-containing protein [Campylobacteraceae bacterium]|jgi:hypothetical protein|nr:DUF87 domain-containing protein [Campylobacteraceae bacterium]